MRVGGDGGGGGADLKKGMGVDWKMGGEDWRKGIADWRGWGKDWRMGRADWRIEGECKLENRGGGYKLENGGWAQTGE